MPQGFIYAIVPERGADLAAGFLQLSFLYLSLFHDPASRNRVSSLQLIRKM